MFWFLFLWFHELFSKNSIFFISRQWWYFEVDEDDEIDEDDEDDEVDEDDEGDDQDCKTFRLGPGLEWTVLDFNSFYSFYSFS
jgi:hypothetical protein